MRGQQDAASKAKTLRLLQFISPSMFVVVAFMLYWKLKEPLNMYLLGGFLVLAGVDFLVLRWLADKAAREAE